ncbi:MAG TPA: hypothetical protein VFX25_25690 [Streptosporangiaceae bacterium]|nr:hypothetical protein [Streptosporangiaceae bacterium]
MPGHPRRGKSGSPRRGKVLESHRATPETVRQRAAAAAGRGEQAPSGHLAFTPQAKDVGGRQRRTG